MRDELYEVGVQQRRRMFGAAGAEDQVDHTTDLNDKLQDFVTRYCFGDIWQRPGLSIPDRSKVTFSMLVAAGKPHEMKVHARGALENGVTPIELREIVVQSVLYCGIPAAVEGLRALETVFAEMGVARDLDGEAEATAGSQEAKADRS
ncbi:carboxymuconolactone decarboxylase family protein [Microbacterium sp. LRZ72]|uniref:carboxymuconolactone decarboxylase family protein n=1 Tax=Microbacterium sp. LRZ72 TaxID=2942481 RepID=UPI0029A40100|nr:carboxymuconolactone decarboxylase family protein [Microbacterium sp. LRZ72]MDX2376348.1 carboxymuconolactone decarboxylase family protein [Microbacterium sp. LRZ72]